MKNDYDEKEENLKEYCAEIRRYLTLTMFSECERLIKEAMTRYPHSAEPHNWMGVVLKERRDLIGAMKHFRADYLPSRYNLEHCGNIFCTPERVALDETECTIPKRASYKVEYDKEGIGHVIKC